MSNDKDNFDMTKLETALNEVDQEEPNNPPMKWSPIVEKRVDVLKEIQSEYDEIEEKFFEERVALEDKYQKIYQPLYTKRYEIVNGVVEVEGAPQGDDQAIEEKGVPNFWLIALKNNEITGDEITERDEGALKYLKDIKWTRLEEPKGFKLDFFFDENPYFKNTLLTKTYHVVDKDEPILDTTIGTEIEWYPGKCLTPNILKRMAKEGSENTKSIIRTEEWESFFEFFSPPEIPEEDEELDDELADELECDLQRDYDIGLVSTIKEEIISHAVTLFTSKAVKTVNVVIDDEDDEEEEEKK
ncbi:unnamed protein product [Cochlearia groenlandica]